MSLEKLIEKGGDWVPPRLVIFGDEKSGKTSTAAQSPKPLYIGTDDGRRRLAVDGLPIPSTWDEFVTQLEQVVEDAPKLGYGSVVTDTLNGVVDLCAEHVCQTQFGGSWNDPKNGFLAWGGHRGWSAVSEEIRRLMPLYDALVDDGLWVILLAHSQTEKVKNPLAEDYDRFAPAIDKKVWSRFGRWADAILRVDYQVSYLEKDGRTKAVSDGTRVLRCAATAAEVAGCRVGYELPAEIPFAWSSIEEHLGQQDTTTLDTLTGLYDQVDTDVQNKVLDYLGIKSIDDLVLAPLHKAKAAINKLTATLENK